MKIISILFFLLFSLNLNAQIKKPGCGKFWSNYEDELEKPKDKKGTNYSYILKQLNAYKACSPENYKEADAAIIRINEEILKQRNDADSLRNLAEEKTKEAIIQRDNAKALYWASESDKLVPNQGIRLLEEAYLKAKSKEATEEVKQQIEKIFNTQNDFEFREKKRFLSIKKILFSPSSKWVTVIDFKDQGKLINLETQQALSFGSINKLVKEFIFSPNGQLLFILFKNNTLNIWNIHKRMHITFLDKEQSVDEIIVSNNSQWVGIKYVSHYTFRVWSLKNKTSLPLIDERKNVTSINFSPDSNFLIVGNKELTYELVSIGFKSLPNLISKKIGIKNFHFSYDSQWIVTHDVGDTIKLWSLNNDYFLDVEMLLPKELYFSKNNEWLIITGYDGISRVFSIPFKQKMDCFKNINRVFRTCISDNDNWMLINTLDHSAYLFDLYSQKVIKIWGSENDIMIGSFSYNSEYVVLRNWSNSFTVYNTDSLVKVNINHNFINISDVYFSNNSKKLIVKGDNESIEIFDLSTAKKSSKIYAGKRFKDVVFSENNGYLFASFKFNESELWEIEEKYDFSKVVFDENPQYFEFNKNNKWLFGGGGMTSTILNYENPHDTPLYMNSKNAFTPIFSNNGNWIIKRSSDSSALVNLSNLEIANFVDNKSGLALEGFSEDSKYVFGKINGKSLVWNLFTKTEVEKISKLPKVFKIIFSQKSKYACIIFEMGKAILFDMQNLEYKDVFSSENNINDITFLNNEQWAKISYESSSEKMKLFDIENGGIPKFLQHEVDIESIEISKDNKWLISQHDKKKLKIWDLKTEKINYILDKKKYSPTILFSPNSQYFIAKIEDEFGEGVYTEIIDLNTGKTPDLLKNEKDIHNFHFSKNDNWLLIRSRFNKAKLFDLKLQKLSKILENENSIDFDLFSEDERYLSIISNRYTKTWDLPSYQLIQTVYSNKKYTPYAEIRDNRFLNVISGKAIIKTDLEIQKGNFFSYGDGEPLDYTFEEIQEWIKVFGDKYLLPLDEDLKKKYGITKSN